MSSLLVPPTRPDVTQLRRKTEGDCMCVVVSRRLLQGLKYHYGSPGSLSDARRTSCEGTAVHIYE